jgi:hypothetical protein
MWQIAIVSRAVALVAYTTENVATFFQGECPTIKFTGDVSDGHCEQGLSVALAANTAGNVAT